MTDTSPADTLRAAANRLTQPGARILVTPRLIQPLTDWLTAEASTWAGDEVHSQCSPTTCTLDAALTVARAILGPDAPPDDPTQPQEQPATTDQMPVRDVREDLLDAIDSTYAYGVLGYDTPEILADAYRDAILTERPEQPGPDHPADGHTANPGAETPAYAWTHAIDTIDDGRTICIPGIHHGPGGEEERSVLVSRGDLPALRAMLADADDQTALARVRAVRNNWLSNTLEPGQVRRLLDALTHALHPPTQEP